MNYENDSRGCISQTRMRRKYHLKGYSDNKMLGLSKMTMKNFKPYTANILPRRVPYKGLRYGKQTKPLVFVLLITIWNVALTRDFGK